MKLYLIRHGESQGNVNRGFISGRSDPNGLTIKGKAQITRTAWELRKHDFTHLYFSPVARAAESAQIISDLLDIPSTKLDFLQEMSYGKFEGHYFWDMMAEARVAFERWNREFSYPFPDGEGRTGESLEMVSNRVWEGYNAWLQTIDTAKKSNLIFVSHDAIISTLLFCLMYGHPAATDATASYKRAFMEFVHGIDVPNGSVFEVDLHAKPVIFRAVPLLKHPVSSNDDSISFYVRGMEKHTKVTLEEKITASENRVFHLINEHDSLLKLMHEKEIVSSERIVSIYKYLKKNTTIDAPEVLLYDKTQSFFPETVVIQDYRQGMDLRDMLSEKKCQLLLLQQSLDTLKMIHSIPVRDVEEFWYPDDTWHKVHIPWSNYMVEEIDLTMKMLKKSIPDEGLRKSIRGVLKDLRETIAAGGSTLVPLHGDFAPQNIVVADDKKIRVIDFERARIGDRIWDYAYYYGWLQRVDAEVALQWKNLVQGDFTQDEMVRFHAYTVLFHAWTVRDIFEYKKNSIRARRGQQSIRILVSLF